MIVKFFWDEKRNIPDQATHKVDNKDYAIKIIKPDSDMDTLEELRREVKNLSQLSHKNVVRYFNSWIETARLPDSQRYLTEEDRVSANQTVSLSFFFVTLSVSPRRSFRFIATRLL
jgi:serine/threonine protein kinase